MNVLIKAPVTITKRLRGLLCPLLMFLGGCDTVLLHPPGHVAHQQSHTLIISVILISLIVVPVIIAIGVVAWRYRASNDKACYQPDWENSPPLEFMVWAGPMIIILALGAISWIGTHQLDPYRPLDHIAPDKPVSTDTRTLEVHVVSLRWKWLFFYPQYGVATVNQLAAPVNVPINFKLTSDPMMDSFFIPALVGQIYTMAGMQTVLHGVISKPGRYKGFSSNYSGEGFTDMRFSFDAMTSGNFRRWVAKVRASGGHLDRQTYNRLRQPERHVPVRYYAYFQPDLYNRILNMCVNPGQMCMSEMMAADAGGSMHGMHHHATSGQHPHADTAPSTKAH